MTYAPEVKIISESLTVDENVALKIIEKALAGGEIKNKSGINEWIHLRLLPNVVFIDLNGYTEMCVSALKIVGTTAATDYGSSRQRDLGQLWADMTRGYLGEMAFKIFLEKKFGVKADLGHELGELKDYLPMDIHAVEKPGESSRPAKIGISIKATKWNGIWLDIPGDQFAHSDIHVLVKVGVGRDHLFSFFKQISVFKDKVLKCGEDLGCLTKEESSVLYDSIPSFNPVPAYICGFAKKSASYQDLPYGGKKGRKHYKINAWNGPIKAGDLDKIKIREAVEGNLKFEGIDRFSHENGYLFNAGSLLWKDEDWKEVCDSL